MAVPKDVFVFDCVCHIFNFDKSNAFGSLRIPLLSHQRR